MLDLMGMERGVLNAFHGMYTQLQRKFKIKGCLGPWWQATNGILQGFPLSVIVINALTTTWKRMIDDIKKPVVVATKGLPSQPKEPETPSCWWNSVGAGADQAWILQCEVPPGGGATPRVLGRQLPPPPPQGASGRQLVVKGMSPRSQRAPKAPRRQRRPMGLCSHLAHLWAFF